MIRSNAFVFAAVALGVTFGTGVASAADLPARPYTKAPPLQPVPVTWSGCYLGGNIGAGWDHFSAGEVGFAGVPTPFVDSEAIPEAASSAVVRSAAIISSRRTG
jgi:hypothetical protein